MTLPGVKYRQIWHIVLVVKYCKLLIFVGSLLIVDYSFLSPLSSIL